MKSLRIVLTLSLILAVPVAGTMAFAMETACSQHEAHSASGHVHDGHGESQDCGDDMECRCIAQHCSAGANPTVTPPLAHVIPAGASALPVAAIAAIFPSGFPDHPLRPPISV